MRVLEAALSSVWAMEPSALDVLLSIAARENDTSIEALEAYRAKTLAGAERAKVRDGVAIIDIIGATFKRANLMTAVSGATSYELIRADLQAALDDPSVKAILLNIDSPGGEASGTGELANAIYQARGKKPIVAYIGGQGASAAYWTASGADRIVIDAQAMLGSIGVQMGLREPAPKAGEKTYRFVSSQSPLKNADPGSDAGAEAIQSVVDAMAQVFVEAVARNRGVATETVLNDFGKGGIFIGKDAVKAGLADALGDFESVLAELAGRKQVNGGSTRKQGTSMSENSNTPEATAAPVDHTAAITAAVTAALTADRTRTAGLERIAAAHGVEASVLTAAKADGSTVEAFALAVADLASTKAAQAGLTALAALKKDETTAAKIEPSADNEPGEKTAEDMAGDIIAAANAASGS